MLETLREFAQERLVWRAEVKAVQQRHAHYYFTLAAKTESKLRGAHQVAWLARLDQEQENLRAALQWLLEITRTEHAAADLPGQNLDLFSGNNQAYSHPVNFAGSPLAAAALALQMAADLALYWEIRGFYSEGRHWLSQVLAIQTGENRDVSLLQARAKALNKAGDLAFLQGEFPQARLFLEESLTLKRQLEDKAGIATVLNSFGNLAVWQREFDQAIQVVEESLAIRQELNDSAGIAIGLRNLGNIYTATGDYQQAAEVYSESLAIAESLNNKLGQATALGSLGKVFLLQEHFEQAGRLLEESLRLFEELGDKRRIAITIDLLGNVYLRQGHYEQAFQFSFKSLELERELGDRWGIAASLHNLGDIKLQQAQYNAALGFYKESLVILGELGERYIGDGLDNLAALAVVQQEYTRAAQLYAASDRIRRQTNSPREATEQTKYSKRLAQIQGELGEPAFRLAWSQGQELELDQALTLAHNVNYLGSGQN
jgi:tetratricopeptide (TPR) repeat protein